jgi:hypothetical protein
VAVAVHVAFREALRAEILVVQLSLGVMERLLADPVEGLIAGDPCLGVDGAQVDIIAGDVVAMVQVKDDIALGPDHAVLDRIEIEEVAVGAAKEIIPAVSASDDVVAGTASELIVMGAADEQVVAGLAEYLA